MNVAKHEEIFADWSEGTEPNKGLSLARRGYVKQHLSQYKEGLKSFR